MKTIKILSALAMIFASVAAFAAAPGKISASSVSGSVVTIVDGAKKQLAAGDVFTEKTAVLTSADASAKIVLANGTVIGLEPNTTIEVAQFVQNDPSAVEGQDFASFSSEPEATFGSMTTVRLVKGVASFKVASLLSSSKLTVETRAGQVAVKGTTFSVSDNGTHVTVSVVEGNVEVALAGRAPVSLDGGKSVQIPVGGTTAGTPTFRNVSPEQEAAILASVGVSPVAATAPAADEDERVIGLDPELPDYARDASVEGPDHGYLPDINSAASM